MSEKADRIIVKSAYRVSEELNYISASLCAEGYFNADEIDETDIDKMLKALCPLDFACSDGEINRQEGLEYIKESIFSGR